MCLLKAFWKVISPVPVTLKRFFALELVFTFGIIIILSITPYWRSCTGETLVEPCGKWIAKVGQVWNIAKKIAPKWRLSVIYSMKINQLADSTLKN